MLIEVPFVKNPNTRCVPASAGMVLGYFMPEVQFTMRQLEKICDFQEGKATWPTEHMLRLAKMGFELQWIEAFDLPQFSKDPERYLRSILTDPETLHYQLTHSNLPVEAARAKEYLRRKLPFEMRLGTVEDIKYFLDDDWLVRLEVNASTLAGKPGYDGHSVVAIGYTDESIIIHNPDGANGNKPGQHVAWPDFVEAWRAYGGTFSLYAFRLQD